MSLTFFYAERSLALTMLLTQDRLKQIYQAQEKQYASRHKSQLLVCFYDSLCFFLLHCIQEVSKNKKFKSQS